MKTARIQKNAGSKHHSSIPFFTKKGKGNSFSYLQAQEKPFFSPLFVQTKLTIGKSDDKYEKEADNMADKVVKMPETSIQKTCAECAKEDQVQTKTGNNRSGSNELAKPTLPSNLNDSKGKGTSLSSGTHAFMSNAFGADFSNVRIHTNSKAIQMNQDLNARAFTHGSNIYFNKGEYNPNTQKGKHLLAHELTHVIQQKNTGGQINRKYVPQIQKEEDECTPCPGIPPTTCSAYAANRHWLPDAYVFNATCACRETPNEPKANCIRSVLQSRLAATSPSLIRRATRMKRLYTSGAINLIDYNAFVVKHLTPIIHSDHVIAYRTACCPSGPAPYAAWIGVTTVEMPNCASVWWAIRWGGGSCSGNIGSW